MQRLSPILYWHVQGRVLVRTITHPAALAGLLVHLSACVLVHSWSAQENADIRMQDLAMELTKRWSELSTDARAPYEARAQVGTTVCSEQIWADLRAWFRLCEYLFGICMEAITVNEHRNYI